MKRERQITTVLLVFPNINRTFTYEFPYVPGIARDEEAMRTFYEQEAPTFFALYGYGPMDVEIQLDFVQVSRYKACYQETLWHSFFREGGKTWHGRFNHFIISLIEFRYREDVRRLKAA